MTCLSRLIRGALAPVLAPALALAALLAAASPAPAREPPQQLTWASLLPPAPPGQGLRPFLAGRPKDGFPVDHSPQPGEGRWMSGGAPRPQSETPPAVVEALDGRRVRLGGYVVPLDFDAKRITEFLLVPFVGACIHVPPPPPNQIVYVKSERGIDIKGLFDPVWVTGTMRTKIVFTGLAETGYALDAEAVEARAE